MAAATIIEVMETGIPTMEVVTLTASDGETYESRKFNTVIGVQATSNADVDAHINATFSGSTVTVNFASQTDKTVTLTIFGHLGN